MSRLVVNKTEDRVICIIKNFGSLELSENTVKTIDKYGLREHNIFLLANSLIFDTFHIQASNAYNTYLTTNYSQWSVSSAVFYELHALIVEFYYKRIAHAIESKVLDFGNFKFEFANNALTINFKEHSITDNFKIVRPKNYSAAEFAIVGEKYMLHITQGKPHLEDFYKSPLGFPYGLYNMYSHLNQIFVLQNFIGACLNSAQKEDEFLLVKKLS